MCSPWSAAELPVAKKGYPDGTPSLAVSDGVATVRFERPREHNRIDPDDIPVLRSHLERASVDASVRAVILTGAGTSTFSSGFTVEAIVGRLDRSFEELLDTIERLPMPTLAAINGGVYGGATDLALCCDFRIGVTDARMFMPAARFGLHYYPGGLRRYVAAVGVTQAKRIFLTGQTLDAEEMLRIGFLTDLVPRRQLRRTVGEYIAAIKACEPTVLRSMKAQLNAIAAGETDAALSRTAYEASLASPELRRRLATLAEGRRRSGGRLRRRSVG
jgi:enoyl-CoA hydratase/carnithine racemase